MNPLLKIENINAFYGAAHILHGMSLQVNAGERVALIGRNGVGKTTVVNTILGLAQMRGGSIHFGSTPVARPRPYIAAQHGIGCFGLLLRLEGVDSELKGFDEGRRDCCGGLGLGEYLGLLFLPAINQTRREEWRELGDDDIAVALADAEDLRGAGPAQRILFGFILHWRSDNYTRSRQPINGPLHVVVPALQQLRNFPAGHRRGGGWGLGMGPFAPINDPYEAGES